MGFRVEGSSSGGLGFRVSSLGFYGCENTKDWARYGPLHALSLFGSIGWVWGGGGGGVGLEKPHPKQKTLKTDSPQFPEV